MSGGHFDYHQHKIQDIIDSVEDYLYGHSLDADDVEYIQVHSNYYDEEVRKYCIQYQHTMPNKYGYSKETIKEFKKGLELLRKAYIYAQRIDWLLSDDDGEESFHERLKEDLEELKTNTK